MKYKECPCCGNKTLTTRDEYEICGICGWEDDDVQSGNPNFAGGPKDYVFRLKQYRQIISPDFSILTDMPLALQIFNTFRRRWCSAYWQEHGMTVIPAICWGDERSYEFCFDGISPGSVIAISTLGTGKFEEAYMKGFAVMLEKICPSKIICYGTLYKGMQNNADILHIPLVWNSLRAVRERSPNI